jgi:hypothetical protein
MEELERGARLACDELQHLRRRNEILEAKVSTMELLGEMLFARPRSISQGMGEDPVWIIMKALQPKEDNK